MATVPALELSSGSNRLAFLPAPVGTQSSVLKFVAHSRRAVIIARGYGWFPGARYTNLRDVRKEPHVGFLDIHWKRYDFRRHLQAAARIRPFLTVARDIESIGELPTILNEASKLAEHSDYVVVVPKDPKLTGCFDDLIPKQFLLGYSVPTRYGGTQIAPTEFTRPTHLLGGRPDVQRRLAEGMPVVSLDCNRFTLDAGFGDYFDGETFRPHPKGGYSTCMAASVENITALWQTYNLHPGAKDWLTKAIPKLQARRNDVPS